MRFRKVLQRVVLGLGAVGTILGVATVVVVYRIVTDFHAELMQSADAARDAMLLDAIARASNTMILTLAMIVLVAALNIIPGFVMLMKPRPRRAGQDS